MKRCIQVLIAVILILSPMASYAATYPDHSDAFYVNDFAGILSPETEQEIMSISVPLAEETGAQIVVLTVQSMDGQDIESFSRGTFVQWGIGDAEKHNGVLLVIAMDERMSRIEIGYGLEGALNDAKTGRIQDDYLVGNLGAGNFDEGVLGTYLALAEEVYKEYNLSADSIADRNIYYNPTEEESTPTIFQIIMGIFVGILIILDLIFNRGRLTRFILYMVARSSKGSSRGGGFGGGGGRSGGGGSSRGW